MLTREQFRDSFIGLHGIAATVSGKQCLALPNSRVDLKTAGDVADTFYETILDVPVLHFILKPGNKWLGRALVMGVYVQGMRAAMLEESAQGRAGPAGNFSAAKKATSQPKPGAPDEAQRQMLVS